MSACQEYERLHHEYVLMRHKAQRLGELMCEIGLALQHRPESIVVKPLKAETVDDSAVVLTEHPPTLLAIERVATAIRAVQQQLFELKQALPDDPSSASAVRARY